MVDIAALFRKEGEHLHWARLDDDRVEGRESGEPIEPDRHYATVRLAEMYLGQQRKVWRTYSPLIHAFITSGGDQEEHAIAGPGQLQQLGEANLDRVLVVNFRLSGPLPYRGEDLSIVAGLYSVPREDAATALVTTLGALAGVAGVGATAPQIVQVVKTGVDSVLSLDKTALRLGVLDTFGGANPLRSGFHVAIGAAVADVPADELWLDDGRLMRGGRLSPQRYTGHDYFVLHVERSERRQDWPGLPGIDALNGRLKAILDSQQDADGKRDALNNLWPQFTQALRDSPHLTRHHAELIAADVVADLQGRLQAMAGGGPFETRSWGSDDLEQRAPEDFDLADVPAADGAAAPAGHTPF